MDVQEEIYSKLDINTLVRLLDEAMKNNVLYYYAGDEELLKVTELVISGSGEHLKYVYFEDGSCAGKWCPVSSLRIVKA